jgi:hypothetical protein
MEIMSFPGNLRMAVYVRNADSVLLTVYTESFKPTNRVYVHVNENSQYDGF